MERAGNFASFASLSRFRDWFEEGKEIEHHMDLRHVWEFDVSNLDGPFERCEDLWIEQVFKDGGSDLDAAFRKHGFGCVQGDGEKGSNGITELWIHPNLEYWVFRLYGLGWAVCTNLPSVLEFFRKYEAPFRMGMMGVAARPSRPADKEGQ
jgi:hypothetical protein